MIFSVQERVGEYFPAGTIYDSREVCVRLVPEWCLTSDEVDQIFSLAVGKDLNISNVLIIRRIASAGMPRP
jgi:hypothetical protein